MDARLLPRNKTSKYYKFYIVISILTLIIILQIVNTAMLNKFNNVISENNVTFYIRKIEKLIDILCKDMKC